MTRKEFVAKMQQEIREEGFISESKLRSRIKLRAKEYSITIDSQYVLVAVGSRCDDIDSVLYRHSTSNDNIGRRLYYHIAKMP